MATTIKLFYPILQQYIACRDEVIVEGATVGECLTSFIQQYPEAEKWIFGKNGSMLEQVFVFINTESSRKADLSTPLRENDEIILVMAVIGG